MNRLFPAAFTGFVAMVAMVLLARQSLPMLISRGSLMMGGIVMLANIISDYLWPSVRAEIHSIF